MAKKVDEKFGEGEIRNLDEVNEAAAGAEKPGVVGQRDEEGDVSLVEVYVNPALRGSVAVFDDRQGKEVTFAPGEKYSIDPKTAEKAYHGTSLFVAANE